MDLINFLKNEGYSELRVIPNRGICGIRRFIFTTGLCYGINKHSYNGRYCFSSHADAIETLSNWDGGGDPDGDWIKHKGEHGEYSNHKAQQRTASTSE